MVSSPTSGGLSKNSAKSFGKLACEFLTSERLIANHPVFAGARLINHLAKPAVHQDVFSLSTGFLRIADISTRANDTGLKEAGKGGNHATDRPSRGDKHS